MNKEEEDILRASLREMSQKVAAQGTEINQLMTDKITLTVKNKRINDFLREKGMKMDFIKWSNER